jgi:hypothetical protein
MLAPLPKFENFPAAGDAEFRAIFVAGACAAKDDRRGETEEPAARFFWRRREQDFQPTSGLQFLDGHSDFLSQNDSTSGGRLEARVWPQEGL